MGLEQSQTFFDLIYFYLNVIIHSKRFSGFYLAGFISGVFSHVYINRE